jgi:hypothetical protein
LPLLLAASAGACRQEPPAADNVAQPPVINPPPVVRSSPALDRAGLLAAVAQAASAAASGGAAPAELRALDGRQFEVRIRFGCRGPSAEGTGNWLTWSYDAASRTMRVQARPTISADDPLVASIGGEGFEAAEGFWIPRPWLLQPVCPATAAVQTAEQVPVLTDTTATGGAAAEKQDAQQGAEPLPMRQRVGIAQLFTRTDPRTGRRNSRPYQAVHTLEEGQAIGSQGFNLVLSGRLRAIPGKGVIECSAVDADTPPDCIVSAEFQRVWIEQPETGAVIADWGGG